VAQEAKICNGRLSSSGADLQMAQSDSRSLRLQYCEFVEEVRRRRDIVSDTLQGKFDLPKLAAYEFCYLQFRLICELIGLSCLAAHGEIPATKGRLRTVYQPGQIFSDLERLHPDFFPVPAQIIPGEHRLLGFKPISNGAITKGELKVLYDQECGRVLHKGTMKNLRDRSIDFDRIKELDEKIVRLLNVHCIKLIVPQTHLLVQMMAPEHNDKVVVRVVKAQCSGLGPEPQFRN